METWIAAFKKRGSGKLWWLTCKAKTNVEATDKMRERVKPLPYNLYAGAILVK